MTLSADTLAELRAALQPADLRLEQYDEYFSFIRKWVAFNRAYSEVKEDKAEWQRVRAIANDLQAHWLEVAPLARQLASMECIGSKATRNRLLKPDKWGKSAMLYLREFFKLAQGDDLANCQFGACRPEKKQLCDAVQFDRVTLNDWREHEMAALLHLVYQVRCNLFHGDKRLAAGDAQTRRDSDLIQVSSQILDCVLEWLINAP